METEREGHSVDTRVQFFCITRKTAGAGVQPYQPLTSAGVLVATV